MKRWGAVCVLCAVARLASAADVYTYSIQACSPDVAERSGCDAADPELARWAMEAWQQAAGPGLRFVQVEDENAGRIRIYWLGKRPQLYGDARPLFVNGKRGAAIDVHPDLAQFGARIEAAGRHDKLFRDTVVYLTCLHELGHAIGLDHTADFADIMYSFQYGGDVLEYFSRYRWTLQERPDIRSHSGISEADRKRVASLYASP
jgi:hypothetical protein